jgi:magnesium transporter
MLTVYCHTGAGVPITDPAHASLPEGAVWLDCLQPDEAERAFASRATGLAVPTFEALSEIETSSRLAIQDGTLYLSAPALFGVADGVPRSTPVGYVLNQKLLMTVRFEPLVVFEALGTRPQRPDCGSGIYVALLEAAVDRAADLLERIGAELDQISHQVFGDDAPQPQQKGRKQDVVLRTMLRQIGRHGDLASKIRESLLGVGRMAPYVESLASDWLPADFKPRLKTLRQDIASLSDYDTHLTDKTQFLLDAILGLINIEQNNIIKVLTVVSVVGVPPTFLASMYGMNFKNMPELSWDWGYPYALILMVISAIGPYFWFKYRGWL